MAGLILRNSQGENQIVVNSAWANLALVKSMRLPRVAGGWNAFQILDLGLLNNPCVAIRVLHLRTSGGLYYASPGAMKPYRTASGRWEIRLCGNLTDIGTNVDGYLYVFDTIPSPRLPAPGQMGLVLRNEQGQVTYSSEMMYPYVVNYHKGTVAYLTDLYNLASNPYKWAKPAGRKYAGMYGGTYLYSVVIDFYDIGASDPWDTTTWAFGLSGWIQTGCFADDISGTYAITTNYCLMTDMSVFWDMPSEDAVWDDYSAWFYVPEWLMEVAVPQISQMSGGDFMEHMMYFHGGYLYYESPYARDYELLVFDVTDLPVPYN